MKKKILVSLLSFVLVVTMMPLSVFAQSQSDKSPQEEQDITWNFQDMAAGSGWYSGMAFSDDENDPTISNGLAIIGGQNGSYVSDTYVKQGTVQGFGKFASSTTISEEFKANHYMKFTVPEGAKLTSITFTAKSGTSQAKGVVDVRDGLGGTSSSYGKTEAFGYREMEEKTVDLKDVTGDVYLALEVATATFQIESIVAHVDAPSETVWNIQDIATDQGWSGNMPFGDESEPTVVQGLTIVGDGYNDVYTAPVAAQSVPGAAKFASATSSDAHYMKFTVPDGKTLTSMKFYARGTTSRAKPVINVTKEIGGTVYGTTGQLTGTFGEKEVTLSEGLTGDVYLCFTMSMSGLQIGEITAVYSSAPVSKYTVTYKDSFDKKVIYTEKVDDGDVTSPPSDPGRTGYKFTGWYSNEECTQKYNFNTPVHSNLTIWAGWELIKYNVNVVQPAAHATIDVDKYKAAPGETVTISTTSVDPGYTVIYTLDGDMWASNTFMMPVHNVTVSANVVKDGECLVTFYNGVTKEQISQVSVEKGTTVDIPEDPTMEGYRFEGWCADPSCTTEFNFDTPIMNNTSIYAKFVEAYKVTCKQVEHAQISVDKPLAVGGETVGIMLDYLEDGYKVEYYTVNGAKAEGSSFIMPFYNVEVSVVLSKALEVKVVQPEHAVISVDKTTPEPGETVTIKTESLDPGYGIYYSVEGILLLDGNTFTMRDYDVEVSAYVYKMPELTNFKSYAPNTKEVNVEWDVTKDMVGYYIYRGDQPTGDWGDHVGEKTWVENYYNDTDVKCGQKYYYMARTFAKNSDGSYSFGPYTKVDYAYPRVSEVKGFHAWASDYQTANIAWEAPKDKDVIYFIYKGNAPTGDWGDHVDVVSHNTTTWQDPYAETGVKAYYMIRPAVANEDGTYTYGPYTKVDYAYPRVSEVKGFHAWAPDAENANLAWEAPKDENVVYFIYKGYTPTGDWGKYADIVGHDTTTWQDPNAKTGVKAYYMVRPAVQLDDGSYIFGPYTKVDYAYPR